MKFSGLRHSIGIGALCLSLLGAAWAVGKRSSSGLTLWHFLDSAAEIDADLTLSAEDTTKTGKKVPKKKPLRYPVTKTGEKDIKGLDLRTPPALKSTQTVDDSLGTIRTETKLGDEVLTEEEQDYDDYTKEQNRKLLDDYFRRRSASATNLGTASLADKLNLGGGLNNALSKVEIRPTGYAEVTFSLDHNRVENPSWSIREQRNTQFKFDQAIQFAVQGNIGDKIKMNINYDTKAAFDFDNQRRLNYEGKEDEILRSIQLGDISMPTGGSLITGSQSLFGIKTKLTFGKLDITSVVSQQKSEKKEITLEGGVQKQKFSIQADGYDQYRHYFLGHFFRNNYNRWNQNWPGLSNIQITRVEVWVTNTNISTSNTRSVIGFQDLGEGVRTYNKSLVQTTGNPIADNLSNNLYNYLKADQDFRLERTSPGALNALEAPHNFANTQDYYYISNARQLNPTDFTYNPRLGYISLNITLNPNEALAVAFEYTENGVLHKVGEFARDVPPDPAKPNVLFLKLLKSVVLRPELPIFDLMMKNVYSLNAYQVQQQDFRLQVLYVNDRTGTKLNYIPQESTEPQLNGQPLISVLGLDRLNTQQELKPDGNFDFLEGYNILATNGRIIFPYLEPFGDDLAARFNNADVANKYVYRELYDSTRTAAIQVAQKNRFYLEGYYQSSSNSEISLNTFNVPQGSVKVYSNGVLLTEGADYIVDYSIGRVRITNASILNSGSVIKVEAESNTLFNIQQKTLVGTRLDYRVNPDFSLGATVMYLRESPLTPKVNIGDEPIRNTVMGADFRWRGDSRFLTRAVDALPFIKTKEKSEISLDGEFATMIPGHPYLINDPGDEDQGGVSYLDDFEGSLVPYDLRLGNQWVLASAPRGTEKVPGAKYSNDIRYGYERAQMSWYIVDNLFFRNISVTPDNIRNNPAILSDPYQREVTELEVFPNKQIPAGSPGTLQTFDLRYQPTKRGPYNYNPDLNPDGTLKAPRDKWAGVMRRIETSDFEANNIEFIEMWVMDPFIKNPNLDGDLYMNLGNISEDILRDERKSYENGLPQDNNTVDGVDTTTWGRVSNTIQINNAFSTVTGSRQYQDLGYDGLNDEDERLFRRDYLEQIRSTLNPDAFAAIEADPSNDNFRFYRATAYDDQEADILTRYERFNQTQGNTPESAIGNDGYGTLMPDDEDINRDLTLEKSEDYFEYRIRVNRNDFQVGRNYITSVQESTVTLPNGNRENVRWYQLKIPVREFTGRVGTLQDFRSIRFMRLYTHNFAEEAVFRFARLQLIRGDWRKYLYSLKSPGDNTAIDTAEADLVIQAVNLEENGTRDPIPYVMPPGIIRETDYSTPSLVQQNEQSLSLRTCGLKDGDARSIFKNTNFDIRLYKRLRMFVHAEAANNSNLQDNQLSVFVRLGTDFNANYYEYQYPLKLTRPGQVQDYEIWPDENILDLPLEILAQLKAERDAAGWSVIHGYSKQAERGTITIFGNPNLGTVRTIMIGIRNPKDDGAPSECAEIWVDELRVSDFDEKGGWAATMRAVVKAADFARFEASGTFRSIGYGSIEQSVQERSQVDNLTWGVVSAFELGKFFPAKYNVRIPLYFGYSENRSLPRFNPIAPDVEMNTYKNDIYADNAGKYDSLRSIVEDFTSNKSFNLTGVQKARTTGTKRKPKLYNIENFNFTYAYTEISRRNINNVYDNERNWTGQIAYSYAFTSKPWTPLAFIKNPNLKILSDFNLYYKPQAFNIAVRTDRRLGERLYRNIDDYETVNMPFYDKNFTLQRRYDFRYNLTKSLRFSYSATSDSRIEEPIGLLDTKEKRDTVEQNLRKLGTPTGFQQTADLAWDVPINKLPYLDLVTAQATYRTSYEWRTGPPAAKQLGNTIQNSANIGGNASLSMTQLYSKSKFLGNIAQWRTNYAKTPEEKEAEKLKEEEEAKKKEEADKKKKKKKKPKRRKKVDTKKKKSGAGRSDMMPTQPSLTIGERFIALGLSLRQVTANYTVNDGQAVAGFMPQPELLGVDQGLRTQNRPYNLGAPGYGFAFGEQDTLFRYRAAENGWIVADTNLSTPFMYTHRTNLTAQALLEPFKNFRITVEIGKQESISKTEVFRFTSNGRFESLAPIETGQYTISFMPIRTAFVRSELDGTSPTYQRFEEQRIIEARRLQDLNPVAAGAGTNPNNGFPRGYGPYAQDVLVPAFITAYSGREIKDVFPQMPFPNWRLNYTGLDNIPALSGFLRQVTLTHSYKGSYTVDNYRSALDYDPNAQAQDTDLISKINIDRITISERFEPLIGLNIQWQNNWTTNFEYRKDRTLGLSFTDRRLTESAGTEITIGGGYRGNNIKIRFKRRRKELVLPNDLTFNLSGSYRDQQQIVRVLDNTTTVQTGGQRTYSLTPNVQYVLNKSLTVNVFYKYNRNIPYTSNQSPTLFSSGGFTLRYTL